MRRRKVRSLLVHERQYVSSVHYTVALYHYLLLHAATSTNGDSSGTTSSAVSSSSSSSSSSSKSTAKKNAASSTQQQPSSSNDGEAAVKSKTFTGRAAVDEECTKQGKVSDSVCYVMV